MVKPSLPNCARTRSLPEITRTADIIVAAAGAPVSSGEAESSRGRSFRCWQQLNYGTDGQSGIVGDVVIDEMVRAEAVTPVPGGVGPMTIVYLLSNTTTAAKALCHAA